MKQHKILILTLFVFVLAMVFRLTFSNLEGINPDENLWHNRTNKLINILKEDHYKDLMVSGHPGATVTWQSYASIKVWKPIFRVFEKGFDFGGFPYPNEIFARVHFIYQFPIMLISASALAFIFFALALLTSLPFATIAIIFLFADIYFLGLSRVVQMDATQTSFLLISLFSALLYRKFRHGRYFILASVMMGMAAMTKIYSLSLLPVVWLATIDQDLIQIIRFRKIKHLQNLFISTFLMALIIIITSITLLPPIVIDTARTYATFKKSIFSEGLNGYREGWEFFFGMRYFRGEPRIFYLISFFLRQNFLAFIFLPLSILALIYKKIKDASLRSVLTYCLISIFIWLFFLTIPLKKEDRYIILVHVFVDVVAAGGFFYLASVLVKHYSKITMKHLISGLGVFTMLSISFYFIYLRGNLMGYYNPLLGGAKTSVKLIRTGWGEGLTDAANYINSLPKADDLTVVSWYESSLEPVCYSKVLAGFDYRDKKIDYDVFYINQAQRIKEPEWMQLYFNPENVEYVSYLNGIPYAWVVKRDKNSNSFPQIQPNDSRLGNTN